MNIEMCGEHDIYERAVGPEHRIVDAIVLSCDCKVNKVEEVKLKLN